MNTNKRKWILPLLVFMIGTGILAGTMYQIRKNGRYGKVFYALIVDYQSMKKHFNM